MAKGAVASWLEKAGKKKRTFFFMSCGLPDFGLLIVLAVGPGTEEFVQHTSSMGTDKN